MTPEARSVLALAVTLFGKSLLEELVGNDAGLGEAVHSFPNFDVDPSVFVNQVPEVVFYDDLFRDDVESEAHVFRIGHRGVEVEVGQVNAEEHCARCAYRLLMRSLAVRRSAVGVLLLPGKLMRLPPTVSRV